MTKGITVNKSVLSIVHVRYIQTRNRMFVLCGWPNWKTVLEIRIFEITENQTEEFIGSSKIVDKDMNDIENVVDETWLYFFTLVQSQGWVSWKSKLKPLDRHFFFNWSAFLFLFLYVTRTARRVVSLPYFEGRAVTWLATQTLLRFGTGFHRDASWQL